MATAAEVAGESSETKTKKLKIAVIHPDLGIGGAERLIVDAACQLAAHGHDVHIFTSHHDKNRCFEETLSGSFPVTVYGDFLPRHVFHRFHAVCAYLRCIFVALCMLLWWPSFDVILVDQVSVVIPLLKLKASSKIVFYCHFPDLLLAQHTTILRRLYRKPIDMIEEATTGMADKHISYIRLQLMSDWALAPANTQTPGPQHRADLAPSTEHRAAHSAAVHGGSPTRPRGDKNVSAIKESGRAPSAHPVGFPPYRLLRSAKSSLCSFVLQPQLRQVLGNWMASPATPTEPTGAQEEAAARQSLIGISQSVPDVGAALSGKLPNGRVGNGQDDGGAADKYRSMLMSISNQSPDARQASPTPCPPQCHSNGAA